MPMASAAVAALRDESAHCSNQDGPERFAEITRTAPKKKAAPKSGLQAGDGLAAAIQDQNLRSYISEKRA